MIAGPKHQRFVNVECRALMVPGTAEAGDGFRRATIRIVVALKRARRGQTEFEEEVELSSGNPMSKLKAALKEIELRSGLGFEAWEAVDITRQFLAHAQHAGFRIKGFPSCEEPQAKE